MTTDSVLFPVFVPQGKSRTRFKVGYINRQGETVIAANFDDGTRFSEGLAAVRVKSRWGVIDASGDFVIQPKLWSWCRFRGGLASLATRNGKWGVIDRAGNFIVQPNYDSIGPFEDDRALIRIGDRDKARFGFVDKTGAEAIPPKFHGARGFSEGLAAVKIVNLWGYVVPSGVFKITPRFDGTGLGKRWPDIRAGRFVNRLAPVWSGKDNYRFIDATGCFAFEGSFDDANSFSEDRAVVKRDNRFGFIDTDGRMRIECRFTLACDFSEGVARVTEKESRVGFAPPSGFIDVDGQMIIQPAFYSAESFRDGLCLVTTENSIGYINKVGEFVWQGPYVEYGVTF
jgi:hypothetical protein